MNEDFGVDAGRSAPRRASVAALALVITVAGLGLAVSRFSTSSTRDGASGSVSSASALEGIPKGWSELPDPPESRSGAALVWSGAEVLAWGGCDPASRDGCVPTADGYAFDPASREWLPMPAAPRPGAFADAVRTGPEVIFIGSHRGSELFALAYDPGAETWRALPNPPDTPGSGAVQVWTGRQLLVWGGGRPSGDASAAGAAYEPSTDAWRSIPEAPIGLNLASGMWTGEEMIVFGSLLDGRNHAATPTSVGAAYNPSTGTWRELPPSDLSPQATSAVWLEDRMIGWDYEVHSQEYLPDQDAWARPVGMPLEFSECYPDSRVAGRKVFAFFCGNAALYDIDRGTWSEATGGLLDEEVWSDAYEHRVKMWRFAKMASAGDVLFLAAEGLTLDRRGEACYGCEGSPVSFWAYRPPD